MGYALLSKYRPELMGTAMLWILLFHTWGWKLGTGVLGIVRGAGFGGADILLLLSCVGLVVSLSGREQTYGSFLARRARRVLPAYFLVMVPYTLFLIWQGEATVSTLLWNASLLSYWVGAPGAFNWYVPGIMLFYALTPWCLRQLKRSAHREWLTAGAAAASVLITQVLLRDGYWRCMDVIYRLPLFFLGLLIGLYVWEGRRLRGREAAFWAFVLAAGAAYGAAVLRLGDRAAFLPLPYLFLLAAVPLCLLQCLCFRHLPEGGIRRLLRRIGGSTLEIYLLNVTLFAAASPLRGLLDFSGGTALYYLITIPLNVALGILFHRGLALGAERLDARRKKKRDMAER